ncbi:MAG: RCC1 domain-containing protein [Terrimicrobiaceae bacterium]
MNIAQFQILLQESIDNATTTMDYLFLAKAVQALGMGQIRKVSTYSSLPSASTNKGLLVFVTADQRLYSSTGTDWQSIVSLTKGITYSWGSACCGLLGDGTTVSKSSPVSVIGGFTDWRQISAGISHSLGLRTNGTVWAWGCGCNVLGDGSTIVTTKSSPVSVIGGFTDWCQVSAGGHSLGVRVNGTAWAWGSNIQGALGTGTVGTPACASPVSVIGGFTDWCQVSAGGHSLGVRTNGTAWAWGPNFCGRLGDGTTVNRSSPVSVVGGFTDWCQVSAGDSHSAGVRTNGTAWAWGCNATGALGDGTTVSKSSPVSVVGGFTDWCQVSAGTYHSLGVRINGTAWAWGCGSIGRLGDGTTVNKSSPVSVVGGFTNWCQVSASGLSGLSIGVRTNGTAWVWGNNPFGALGDGTTVCKSSPVSVIGGFTDWCQVSTGSGSGASAIRGSSF